MRKTPSLTHAIELFLDILGLSFFFLFSFFFTIYGHMMVHKIKKEIHRFGLAPNYVAAPFRHGLIGVIHVRNESLFFLFHYSAQCIFEYREVII